MNNIKSISNIIFLKCARCEDIYGIIPKESKYMKLDNDAISPTSLDLDTKLYVTHCNTCEKLDRTHVNTTFILIFISQVLGDMCYKYISRHEHKLESIGLIKDIDDLKKNTLTESHTIMRRLICADDENGIFNFVWFADDVFEI